MEGAWEGRESKGSQFSQKYQRLDSSDQEPWEQPRTVSFDLQFTIGMGQASQSGTEAQSLTSIDVQFSKSVWHWSTISKRQTQIGYKTK